MTNKEIKRAFLSIVDALSNTKREALKDSIQILGDYLKKLPGSFWLTPGKRALVKENMRKSWAERPKKKFNVTMPDGRIFTMSDMKEIALLVGYAEHSAKCYISRGKGSVNFNRDGKTITVRKL